MIKKKSTTNGDMMNIGIQDLYAPGDKNNTIDPKTYVMYTVKLRFQHKRDRGLM